MRFLAALLAALLINALLLYQMVDLTQRSHGQRPAADPPQRIDFIRGPPERLPQPAEREPEPPPPPAAPPPPPEAAVLPKIAARRPSALPPAPALRLELPLALGSGPHLGPMAAPSVVSANELTALVSIPPQYPPAARLRRVEGYVELEFTIGADGQVSDPEVLHAEPAEVFEQAALAAIARWRFEPERRDGRPVPIRASYRFSFRLRER